MARHPDFPLIQRRLRRLDPDFYPASVAIDDEWGPRMAAGIDLLLEQAELAKGLESGSQFVPTAPPPEAAGAPVGMPRSMDRKFGFLYQTPLPPIMVRIALTEFGTLERYFEGYRIAGARLAALRMPASLLMAADDPVIPVADFRELTLPADAHLQIEPYGGHCGFLENARLDGYAERWIAARLDTE